MLGEEYERAIRPLTDEERHSITSLSVELPADVQTFFYRVLKTLNESDIPYAVTGAFAVQQYTSIGRFTKDLDVVVEPVFVDAMLTYLRSAGLQAALAQPHWLAKVRSGDCVVDIIFRSGNGLVTVDGELLSRSVPGSLLGLPVRLISVEDLVLMKAFVDERHRFDGADIAHLILACGSTLDWRYLLRRFGEYWELLLWNLTFFHFVFPGQTRRVPWWVWDDLLGRMQVAVSTQNDPLLCRGTLVSHFSFLADVVDRGFHSPATVLPPIEERLWRGMASATACSETPTGDGHGLAREPRRTMMPEPFSRTLYDYRDELNWVRQIGWSDDDLRQVPIHEQATAGEPQMNLSDWGGTALGVSANMSGGGTSANIRAIRNLYVYKREVPDRLWSQLEDIMRRGGPSGYENGQFGERGEAESFPPR